MKRIELDKGMKVTIEAIENDLTIDVKDRIEFSRYKSGDFLKIETTNGSWFGIFNCIENEQVVCHASIDEYFSPNSYAIDDPLIHISQVKRIDPMDPKLILIFHKLLRNNGAYWDYTTKQIRGLYYIPKCGHWVYLLSDSGTEWLFIYKSNNDGSIQKYVSYARNPGLLYTDSNDLIDIENIVIMRPMNSEEIKEFDDKILTEKLKWNPENKTLDCIFKPGDIVQDEESYYLVKGISGNKITLIDQVNCTEYDTVGAYFPTTKEESDLFFRNLHTNGFYYDRSTNTVNKVDIGQFVNYKDTDYIIFDSTDNYFYIMDSTGEPEVIPKDTAHYISINREVFLEKLKKHGVWFDETINQFIHLKEGDFVCIEFHQSKWYFTYKETKDHQIIRYVAQSGDNFYWDETGGVFLNILDVKDLRLMSEKEITDFHEKNRLRGYKWNPNINGLELYKWFPKDQEFYYFINAIGVVSASSNTGSPNNLAHFKLYNYFKTEREALKCAKEYIEFFKKFKNDNS